ncbi:unnamed protein product, partial [Allacma fusca]
MFQESSDRAVKEWYGAQTSKIRTFRKEKSKSHQEVWQWVKGVLCSRFDHKERKAQKVANLDNFKFDPNENAASFVTELERLSGEVDPSVTEEEIIA